MSVRAFVPAARPTGAKLMLLLPLTMALLVAGTGFLAVELASRAYQFYGTGAAVQPLIAQLGLQIAAITLAAAVLGLGMALGVTRPVRQVVGRLEALAAGDLRGTLAIASTSELDSLGGAVNDAITAVQRYYLQSMTGAIITLDADGRVIGSSAAAEATLGYREEDLVGRRFSEVFTPADRRCTSLAAIEAAIASRKPVAIDDVEILTADGRPVRIGITASYLQHRNSDVIGVTIAFKDLNQMRELRARLQQAEQLATLGTVTAGVAHEIRNPLAALRGLTELLGRDVSPQDRARYVTTMLESIDRLNRLVEDLLVYSKPKSGTVSEVDLAQVIEETVAMARHGVGGRRVALHVSIAPGAPLVVMANRQRIGQVLTNLVLNGVQATPDDGQVTVSAGQRDGRAYISVHNTGSFIPADVRRQLFVPFFTTKPGGTGLGLAIARQIVTAFEGRIDVDSDPDAGTTFTIELPLAREAVAA